MAIMLGTLYKALLEAHASDDTARAAAEEVAGYEMRLSRIEARLDTVLWMIGVLLTLQIAFGVGNLWLTINLMGRLSR